MRTNAERVQELLRVSREHAMLAADPDLASDLLDVNDELNLAKKEIERQRARADAAEAECYLTLLQLDATMERGREQWGTEKHVIALTLERDVLKVRELSTMRQERVRCVNLCRQLATDIFKLDANDNAIYRAEGALRCAAAIERGEEPR